MRREGIKDQLLSVMTSCRLDSQAERCPRQYFRRAAYDKPLDALHTMVCGFRSVQQ
jgi:hypothetical protein